MNSKPWFAATVVLSIAAWAGCAPPPTNLYLPSSSGDSTTGGSGGSGGDAPTTQGSARAFFESTVYPDFQTRPGPSSDPMMVCTGCHSTGLNGAPVFFAGSAAGSYTAITTYNHGAFL